MNLLFEINQIVYNGMPLTYIRNESELKLRDIREFIWKDEEVEKICWDIHYISELSEKKLKKLYEYMNENKNIFFEKNKEELFNKKNISINTKKQTEKLIKSLSWSKIYSWLNNKKGFIKTYFEKEPFFETKEILFGSALWKMIELQEYNDEDRIVEECMTWNWERSTDTRKEEILRKSINNIKENTKFVEKLQELEFDLYSEYENKFQDFINWVCTLWFSDNCSSDWKGLKEFKTWKTAWDDERVNNHWQLDLYCLLTYLKKWYFPNDVELIWFPTAENENGEIIPSWEIKKFKFDVEKNKQRILAWQEKIPKIFEEIQVAQKEWENQKNNENESEFSENLFFQVYELQKQIDKLTDEQKDIKKQIEENMKAGNLKDYKVEWIGSVFYTQRKKYEYSEEIINAEKDFKKMKKDFEAEAEPTITESLSFRFSK